MLTIGSLFSGIGGLEWAGLGPTLWQVEKDPKCRAVLAAHWPEAVRYEDVCSVGAAQLVPVDLICGGFPCQDISSAGRRAGLAGARSGLWHQFARILGESRPRFVVIENVRSGARKYVDSVRGELGRLGYASFPVPLSAGDCGAPHARARVFIVGALADRDGVRRGEGLRREPVGATAQVAEAGCENHDAPDVHGGQLRVEPGRQRGTGRPGAEGESSADAPDADGVRESQPERSQPAIGRWPGDGDRHWTAEPSVARMVHGLPGRVDRERMLGNSVVPQCAEVIGHVIRKLSAGLSDAREAMRPAQQNLQTLEMWGDRGAR